MSRNRRREKQKDDGPKPISARAGEALDWLDDIMGRGGIVRRFKLWWHRDEIVDLAIEALEAIGGHDKLLDKIRKAVAIQVTALGGPAIDWKGQAVKKGGSDD